MIRNAVRTKSPHEGLITALAIGGFFIILGLVFALTPGLSQKTNTFFSDLTTVTFPFGGPSSTMSLLAPANPAEHMGFYTSVVNFLLGVAILQIVILALRLWVKSPIGRIAETVGNLIFWLGAAVMANVSLLTGTLNGWFQFWSALIMLIGASLIARFIVYFARKKFKGKEQINHRKFSIFLPKGLLLNIGSVWFRCTSGVTMPKQEKGKSHSMRPVSRRPPSWCKYQPEEVDSFIIKLAKEGHSLSAIGTILRDQYAIPLVKPITGKSISDTLKASGLAPTMPEDLSNLMKKAQALAVHMDKNKKDLHNKRNMQIIEAQIHKLSRYYKREGVLAKNWKYVPKIASVT